MPTKTIRKWKQEPTLSDVSDLALPYESCGHCSFCLLPLEAIQPGGRNPRHSESKIPYGQCPEALKSAQCIARGEEISPMRPPNEVWIAKLNHYGIDPREIRHWRYVKDATGGGHRVFDPIFPGEERH